MSNEELRKRALELKEIRDLISIKSYELSLFIQEINLKAA